MSFTRRQTRSTSATVEEETLTLYVLECEDDCWYVGITGNLNQRYSQHCGRTRGGAVWTTKHRPISIHSDRQVPKHIAKDEESKQTARLMLKYGINRVRGGSMCWGRSYTTEPREVSRVTNFLCNHLGLDKVQTRRMVEEELERDSPVTSSPVSVARSYYDDIFAINEQIRKFNIGGPSSSTSARTGDSQGSGRKTWDSGCERCGWESHTVEKCFAKTDRDGDPIV